uniref:Uncharacterized protein n=1 Tax=Moniliophthora roreri TaxID=221103 RepID=A0A0W0GA49_MONRR
MFKEHLVCSVRTTPLQHTYYSKSRTPNSEEGSFVADNTSELSGLEEDIQIDRFSFNNFIRSSGQHYSPERDSDTEVAETLLANLALSLDDSQDHLDTLFDQNSKPNLNTTNQQNNKMANSGNGGIAGNTMAQVKAMLNNSSLLKKTKTTPSWKNQNS